MQCLDPKNEETDILYIYFDTKYFSKLTKK